MRSSKFGKLEAGIFLFLSVGPFIGGLLARFGGIVFPFAASFLITTIELCWVIFILRESRDSLHETESIQEPDGSNSLTRILFKSFGDSFTLLTRDLRTICCSGIIILITLTVGSYSMFQLYLTYLFHWDAFDIGLYILCIALSRFFWLGVMLPLFVLWKWNQLNLIKSSLLIFTIGYSCNAIANQEYQFFLIGIIDGFGSISMPLLRGYLSSATSGEKQGVLFSSIAVVQQLGSVVSPLIYGFVYQEGLLLKFPGLFCLVSSLVYLLCLTLSFGVRVGGEKEDVMEEEENLLG